MNIVERIAADKTDESAETKAELKGEGKCQLPFIL